MLMQKKREHPRKKTYAILKATLEFQYILNEAKKEPTPFFLASCLNRNQIHYHSKSLCTD